MSVTTVTELAEQRRCEHTLEKGQRKYWRTFKVITNDADDGPGTVLSSLTLPSLGATYITGNDTDTGAVVVDRTATLDADSQISWTVTIEYNSMFANPNVQNPNPLSRPDKWTFSFEKYQQTVLADANGFPIINSALQPFETGYTAELSRPIINLTVNRASFDYAYVVSIQDAVNVDVWQGFDIGTLKVNTVEVQEQSENGITFWEIKYVIAVKWDGWNPVHLLDCGYYEYLSEDPSTTPNPNFVPGLRIITDIHGRPVNSPALLDGNGRKLPPGYDPVFLGFQMYREISFAGIPA